MEGDSINIYISTSGNDLNSGASISEAVKSFEKVMQLIRANKGKSINVFIGGGKYYLSKTMEFNNDNTNGSIITFKPHNNEAVTISGAEVVDNPTWTDYTGNIKKCNVGAGKSFEMLFVNNAMQVLARYPNYVENEMLNGYADDSISAERVSKWANPAGGFIRAIHSSDWGGNDYIINSKNEDNTLNYTWVGDHNQGNGMHSIKLMVENIFEELDAEQEWFYNKVTGDLYFYPQQGTDLTNSKLELVSLYELVRFVGSSNQSPVKNVSFENIHFTQSNRTMFSKTYERPLRSDWGIVRSGAIYFQNSENISIKNCKFNYIGGNAIMMSAYNSDNIVDYNDFTDIGASAVLIVGLQSATRDASTWDNNNHKTIISDTTPGPLTEDYPRDITVSNNYMYNLGIFEKQVAGVSLSISRRVTVDGNTVHHVPRAGINIGDGTFGGHIIQNNDVFDTIRETGDHGPFNSWGRDRFWSLIQYDHMGAYGAEKFPHAKLDVVDTNTLKHNRIVGDRGFGIDLDDGSTNYEIYNNITLRVGIKLREGFYRKVYNNVLIGAPLDIHCTYEKNSDQIYSNIVYAQAPVRYAGGATNTGVRQTDLFEKNLYWYNNESVSYATAVDGMSLSVDPKFIRQVNDNNFQVAQDSLALTDAVGFVNFDMTDSAFGRTDKPKPLPYLDFANTGSDSEEIFEGAKISNLSEGICSSLAIPFDTNGVALLDFVTSSYFAKAGFKKYDVICSIDNKTTENIATLYNVIATLETNKTVKAKIMRDSVVNEIEFVV